MAAMTPEESEVIRAAREWARAQAAVKKLEPAWKTGRKNREMWAAADRRDKALAALRAAASALI